MDFHQFRRPRWLFFDLDDTLLDFNAVSAFSLKAVFREFHEINSIFESVDDFMEAYHSNNSALWKAHSEGKISADSLRMERWKRTLFPDESPAGFAAICSRIDSRYLWILSEKPVLNAGACEVLAELATRFMIGVLSNGFQETQYRKIYNSGLARHISRMIISAEIGIQKPDKRIFDYCIAETGAEGRPIMVGDNPDTDIIGAMNAGWEAIWFNPEGKDFPYSPDSLHRKGIDPALFLGTARDMEEVKSLIGPL